MLAHYYAAAACVCVGVDLRRTINHELKEEEGGQRAYSSTPVLHRRGRRARQSQEHSYESRGHIIERQQTTVRIRARVR